MTRSTTNLALLAALVLAAWQALHWIVGDTAITAPAPTIRHLWDLARTPEFWEATGNTAWAFLWAACLSAVGGVLLGVALGSSRLVREAVEPVLISIYSLPKITLYPIILLVFGLGFSAKVALGVLHGFVPVAILTMNAVGGIDRVFIRSAHALSLSVPRAVWSIYLPAALPGIISGLRVGLSLSLLGTLIGEMFASQSGLGSLLMKAIELAQVQTILAVALFLSIFALVMNATLLAIDHHFHRRA